jgi:hypothetical protein
MGSPVTRQQTGTAADLVKYETFHDVSANVDRLTRMSTANQDFIVRDWDGETYVIKFDANFAKKHLFTFSKKQNVTIATAQAEAAKPGQAGKDAENWHNAEIQLLENKIVSNLTNRNVADTCNCGHKFSPRHLHPAPPPPGKKVPGPCTQAGCGCAAFQTPYGLTRSTIGKPTADPLTGAKTSRNTCIILNWVPKHEFEDVVVQSIQAVEKAPDAGGAAWKKGDNLRVPVALNKDDAAGQRELKWDFTSARIGVIINATLNPGAAPTYANFQGCWVKARKIATSIGTQTWEIFHMATQAPHMPF